MSGIPNQAVPRKVENGMKGDAKFDNTEIGSEVNGTMVVKTANFVPYFGGEVF
jgi:hypothetical protein